MNAATPPAPRVSRKGAPPVMAPERCRIRPRTAFRSSRTLRKVAHACLPIPRDGLAAVASSTDDDVRTMLHAVCRTWPASRSVFTVASLRCSLITIRRSRRSPATHASSERPPGKPVPMRRTPIMTPPDPHPAVRRRACGRPRAAPQASTRRLRRRLHRLPGPRSPDTRVGRRRRSDPCSALGGRNGGFCVRRIGGQPHNRSRGARVRDPGPRSKGQRPRTQDAARLTHDATGQWQDQASQERPSWRRGPEKRRPKRPGGQHSPPSRQGGSRGNRRHDRRDQAVAARRGRTPRRCVPGRGQPAVIAGDLTGCVHGRATGSRGALQRCTGTQHRPVVAPRDGASTHERARRPRADARRADQRLGVPTHHIGDSRLIGARPPSA